MAITQKLDLADTVTGYKISGYYLSELPDQPAQVLPGLAVHAPKSMTKFALDQTRAQLQLCTYYSGKSPYDEVSITEQLSFNFGQSWPGLVYLPISALYRFTQRWMLFGSINSKFTRFGSGRQHRMRWLTNGGDTLWAGHPTHDQWLSEGFAEFSAACFLQQAVAAIGKGLTSSFGIAFKAHSGRKYFGVAPTMTQALCGWVCA